MTGWMLLLFVVGIVLSMFSSLGAFCCAMQILKIDASSSAVGIKGRSRTDNLRDFLLGAILAPTFACMSFGIALSLEKGWYMVALSLAITFMQAVSAPYIAINIVEPPARSTEAKQPLRQVS